MCIHLLPLFLLLSYTAGYVLDTPQLHKTFGTAELRKVFQVDTQENVPNYEVVRIRSISKREVGRKEESNARHIHLSAFGKGYNLRLHGNEPFQDKLDKFKIFLAESTDSGLKYREMPTQNESDVWNVYHDDKNMAAVTINEDNDGNIQMDGTIGSNLVIKPVPNLPNVDETDDDYIDDEMFLDDEDEIAKNTTTTTQRPRKSGKTKNIPKRTPGAGAHIVYKRKLDALDHSDFLGMEPARGDYWRANSTHKRRKRDAPDTVWPEVLLIVDYDTFILHGGNSQDIKRYFVSFWNGVDLRYKQLSHPTIRVSLAGMIVAKDRDATPYLEQNRLRSPNADAVDAAGALTDLGKYLYREDRLPTYDLAVVITKLDMCRRRFQGGRCNRGTAGFAYVGGACVVNKRLEKVNSVAIIEDSGGFSGIIVAAHEVGHLLGCVHDGSPPPSYLGGPGATRCPWEDGFIMSDLRHTERGFRWSTCSVEQFKHFLNGETATCLYNFPHENDLLPRVLPGTTMTLDQQCKRDRGTTACFRDGRVCAQLFCFDSSSGYCVSYRPAAEGSPCGDGQVCKNGRCLAEIENIIPDYTHVTQTFANRPQTDIFARRSGGSSSASTTRQPRSRRPVTARKVTDSSTPSPPPKYSQRRCEDSAQKLGGSLTCREFLQKFGNRYCSNNYMKKNCCASHSQMCHKG